MKKLALALVLSLLASPALAQQSVVVPATTGQVAIAGTAASIVKIVSGVTGKSIYVTAVLQVPVATSAVTFSYGSGTNCGTGTTTVTGVMLFAAGQILALGTGNGAVWVIPPGKDLCITIATAAAPGSLAYSQF